MKHREYGDEQTKVVRIYFVTALKTDCIKTSAQELYMCASAYMYVFWGKSNVL